jgi:hypothetical protein
MTTSGSALAPTRLRWRVLSARRGQQLDDLIAEGETVVSRWTGRGTQHGELMGVAATGKQVTVTGVVISRFSGGKAAEDWKLTDTLGMMQQLGVIPTPELAVAAR